MQNFLIWLEATRPAVSISESSFLFPGIEFVHVLFITLVVGSIAMVDLRLLNLYARNRTVGELLSEVLPWTWVSFVFALVTGGLLFSSAATRYWGLTVFRIKMLLLVLAGINMLVFHFFGQKTVADWGSGADTPRSAKISGSLSLLLWFGIICMGRWIGFV